MVSEAQKKASIKYKAKMIIRLAFDLNTKTDADILEFLNQSDEPSATLIKRLIRDEIKRINKINTFI